MEDFLLVFCLHLPSIVVTKHHEQKQLGEERVCFGLYLSSWSIIEEVSTEIQAGAERGSMDESCYWLAPRLTFS